MRYLIGLAVLAIFFVNIAFAKNIKMQENAVIFQNNEHAFIISPHCGAERQFTAVCIATN